MTDKLLDTKITCGRLGIKKTTLHKFMLLGELLPVEMPPGCRLTRFRESDVDDWIIRRPKRGLRKLNPNSDIPSADGEVKL